MTSLNPEKNTLDVMGWTARVILALALLVTGAVFLMDSTGANVMSGNWWVLYLIAVGFGSLFGAYLNYRHEGALTRAAWVLIGFAVLLFILSAIFIFDPTWSFTRGWNFVLFRDVNWNVIWPVIVIALGLLLLLPRRGTL